jgi:hypothetical protein
MMFFINAYSYCKANDLDLTPEADTGNGPVDFKVSKGFSSRIIVEIKLSNSKKLLDGYHKQLEAYTNAEECSTSYYLVILVSPNVPPQLKSLINIYREQTKSQDLPRKKLIVIDGRKKPSASKL